MVGHTTSGEALTGLELKLCLSLTSGKRLLYCIEGAELKRGQAYFRPLPQAKPRKMWSLLSFLLRHPGFLIPIPDLQKRVYSDKLS